MVVPEAFEFPGARMIKAALLVAAASAAVPLSGGQTTREPRASLAKQIGLSDPEIAAIDRGDPVVKVLPSRTPAEIFLFGAVYVNAAPEAYVRLAFDMSRLRRLPGYLAVARFADPPTLADLKGFSLEPNDITSLKRCRAGRCSVQLPTDAMQELQRVVDWSAADVGSQVNDETRRMALALVRRYQLGGNGALGTYGDKNRPVHVSERFASLLSQSEAFPVSHPELNRYLLDYPDTTLPNVESLFYWEKVDFGLKPTLRVNHAIAYQPGDPHGAARVVAVKQLYASHYFQVALDLAACVTDGGRASNQGFYLITLKASRQDGLTGLRGSLVRRLVVGRTRAAQERALISIKTALESR